MTIHLEEEEAVRGPEARMEGKVAVRRAEGREREAVHGGSFTQVGPIHELTILLEGEEAVRRPEARKEGKVAVRGPKEGRERPGTGRRVRLPASRAKKRRTNPW